MLGMRNDCAIPWTWTQDRDAGVHGLVRVPTKRMRHAPIALGQCTAVRGPPHAGRGGGGTRAQEEAVCTAGATTSTVLKSGETGPAGRQPVEQSLCRFDLEEQH